MKTYSEKLKDPRWQRKRLEIMERDNFKCTQCGDKSSTLNIHHWKYAKTPWESSNHDLSTVCEGCHKQIEKCKELSSMFLRQVDFRHGLLHMERLLNKFGEIKTYFDEHVALFEGVTKRYRTLNGEESVRKGDEYWDGESWEIVEHDKAEPYMAFEFGDVVRRIEGYIPPPLDELSAFDRLIESAPEE